MQFHILSFEGPDGYARAGGIASRITGLSEALAQAGFQTHLWFVGDPSAPGHETHGNLHLHRWCQWISRYHPNGVYEGEQGKCADYAASLPPYLMREVLGPSLAAGARAVVLAEEWHTANAVLHLDHLLRQQNVRDKVCMLWNANNTFGFEGIDWRRLGQAAVITTVSRYMKHLMQNLGSDPLVFPNGLSPDAFLTPDGSAVAELRRNLKNRVLLTKVARWDPDKRWLLAIDTVGELKRQGVKPLLVARGGMESHGADVMARAAAWGLRVAERRAPQDGLRGLVEVCRDTNDLDIIDLHSHIDADGRRVLFRASDAVLANSGHEPFGLVGLETMAAGGVACTGCSGEDYAIAGRNAMVMQTADPREFVSLFQRMKSRPDAEQAMRRAGRQTAEEYAWSEIIQNSFLPRLEMLGSINGTPLPAVDNVAPN